MPNRHMTPGCAAYGWMLVLFQFALFILLAWPWSPLTLSYFGLLLTLFGGLVGIWTLSHNRIGNFNVHPAPKFEGRLIISGPYHLVRHPMYSAVLLVAAAAVFFYDAEYRKVLCWLALILDIWLKTLLEEKALGNKFTEYSDYSKRTGRFIPRLF